MRSISWRPDPPITYLASSDPPVYLNDDDEVYTGGVVGICCMYTIFCGGGDFWGETKNKLGKLPICKSSPFSRSSDGDDVQIFIFNENYRNMQV